MEKDLSVNDDFFLTKLASALIESDQRSKAFALMCRVLRRDPSMALAIEQLKRLSLAELIKTKKKEGKQ